MYVIMGPTTVLVEAYMIETTTILHHATFLSTSVLKLNSLLLINQINVQLYIERGWKKNTIYIAQNFALYIAHVAWCSNQSIRLEKGSWWTVKWVLYNRWCQDTCHSYCRHLRWSSKQSQLVRVQSSTSVREALDGTVLR